MSTNENSIQDLDALLTESQAAQFLGFSERALQSWRCRGGGPEYIRVSSRAIRYTRRSLIEWANERRRSSTSDQGGAA